MSKLYEQIIKMLSKREISQEERIINNINAALNELYYARNNFDMVVGADNVELAIYELNTAEKRYQNLLKEAKRIGLSRFGNNKLNMLIGLGEENE